MSNQTAALYSRWIYFVYLGNNAWVVVYGCLLHQLPSIQLIHQFFMSIHWVNRFRNQGILSDATLSEKSTVKQTD